MDCEKNPLLQKLKEALNFNEHGTKLSYGTSENWEREWCCCKDYVYITCDQFFFFERDWYVPIQQFPYFKHLKLAIYSLTVCWT